MKYYIIQTKNAGSATIWQSWPLKNRESQLFTDYRSCYQTAVELVKKDFSLSEHHYSLIRICSCNINRILFEVTDVFKGGNHE